jgi:release factor glutamine methyltransferase
MTIADCIQKIAHTLKTAGHVDPRREARFILQEALRLSAAELVRESDRELSLQEGKLLSEWEQRRAAGEPLAYISGRKGFYKAEFLVEPGILVPRPETEFVITTAMARLLVPPAAIADFGCGSGCIGLSLLGEWTTSRLWALDISPLAVEVTLRNAERLGFRERTRAVLSRVEDWTPDQPLDLIVANPPYIAQGDVRVEPMVHRYEPHLALYAGKDGFEAIESWIGAAYCHLKNGGVAVFEIGAGQSGAVRAIMKGRGFKAIEVTRDLAGIDRIISAIK